MAAGQGQAKAVGGVGSLYVRRVSTERPELPPGADEGTRGAILLAALKLFAERGFHGTSIRQIGEAVGIKSASLYEHFASKEHILGRLMVIGHEALLTRLRAAVLETDTSARAQARAFVRAHVQAHCAYAMLAVVINHELHALSPEHAAPAMVLRHQAEVLGLEIVQRGVRDGEWDPPNLLATMAAIGSIGIRAAHWFQPSPELGTDELADYYAALALHMLDMGKGSEPQSATGTRPQAGSSRKARGE